LVAGLSSQSVAGDTDLLRVLKSGVCPGLGQLDDGQTFRGLSYMTGEVAFLFLMFRQLSMEAASAHQTKWLEVEAARVRESDQLFDVLQQWEDAHKRTETARNRAYVFGGLAAVVWGINIVDAVLFKPEDTRKAIDGDTIGSHFALSLNKGAPQLVFTF
jgi:hypothetical protein